MLPSATEPTRKWTASACLTVAQAALVLGPHGIGVTDDQPHSPAARSAQRQHRQTGKKTWRIHGVRATMRSQIPRHYRRRALVEAVIPAAKRKLSCRAPGYCLLTSVAKLCCWASLSISIGCNHPNPCRISTEPPVFVILSLWPLAAWVYFSFTGTDFLTARSP